MTLVMRDLENQHIGMEKGKFEGRLEGRLQTLIDFVADKTISLERAAAEYGVSVDDFTALMKNGSAK